MVKFDKVKERTLIKVQGIFGPKDITCVYTPQTLEFTEEERVYIENEWSRQTKLKPFLFNGRMVHIEEQSFNNSKLTFSVSDSSFKEYVATNTAGFKKSFGKDKIIRPLSVGTMIITTDDKWIIGRRMNTFDSEGSYTLVAGYIDPAKDRINSKPDPFFAITREIMEETGIYDTKIADIFCIGLVDLGQPYLAFSTSITMSSVELNCMIPVDKEFTKLQYYDLKKYVIEEFLLNNYERTTSNAIGNILMFYYLHP